jgi:transposase-like protein
MTARKRNTKGSAVEVVAGDRDLMKALMKEALQEVLEGEMTEFLGLRRVSAPTAGKAIGPATTGVTW